MTAEAAIERANVRKDGIQKGFTGEMRSVENQGLELGDVLVMPDNLDEVRVRKFGKGKAEYVFCKLDGTNDVKAFYPSTFYKRRMVVEEDGMPTGQFKYATGTAAELARSFASVNEAMTALLGKKIKVTRIEEFNTLQYGTTTVVSGQVAQLDLVEEKSTEK